MLVADDDSVVLNCLDRRMARKVRVLSANRRLRANTARVFLPHSERQTKVHCLREPQAAAGSSAEPQQALSLICDE